MAKEYGMIQLDCLILDITSPNLTRKAGDYLIDFKPTDDNNYLGISCTVEGEPVYILGGSLYLAGKEELIHIPLNVYVNDFTEPLRVTDQTLIATTQDTPDVLRHVEWKKIDDITDKDYIVVPNLVKKDGHTLWMVAYKKVRRKVRVAIDRWHLTDKRHLMRLLLQKKRSFATPMGFLHV